MFWCSQQRIFWLAFSYSNGKISASPGTKPWNLNIYTGSAVLVSKIYTLAVGPVLFSTKDFVCSKIYAGLDRELKFKGCNIVWQNKTKNYYSFVLKISFFAITKARWDVVDQIINAKSGEDVDCQWDIRILRSKNCEIVNWFRQDRFWEYRNITWEETSHLFLL